MERIDYRKAYDMLPNSWVIESLNMVGEFFGKNDDVLEGGANLWC